EMCSGSGRGESSEHKTNGQLRSRHDGNASAFHAPGPNNKKDPARGAGQGSPPTQRLFFNNSPTKNSPADGGGVVFLELVPSVVPRRNSRWSDRKHCAVPMRCLEWDCSLASPPSHSHSASDMPSASGDVCAAAVTTTEIEREAKHHALGRQS